MDHVPPPCSARERAASREDRSLPLRWGDRGTCVQRPDPRPLAGGCRVSRVERAPSPGGALLNGRVQWRALHRTHLLGPSRAELGPARVFWSPAALKPQTRSSWPCPNHFSFAGFHSEVSSRFTFFRIAELFYTCRLHFQHVCSSQSQNSAPSCRRHVTVGCGALVVPGPAPRRTCVFSARVAGVVSRAPSLQ